MVAEPIVAVGAHLNRPPYPIVMNTALQLLSLMTGPVNEHRRRPSPCPWPKRAMTIRTHSSCDRGSVPSFPEGRDKHARVGRGAADLDRR